MVFVCGAMINITDKEALLESKEVMLTKWRVYGKKNQKHLNQLTKKTANLGLCIIFFKVELENFYKVGLYYGFLAKFLSPV